jgi:hypothetical protein
MRKSFLNCQAQVFEVMVDSLLKNEKNMEVIISSESYISKEFSFDVFIYFLYLFDFFYFKLIDSIKLKV